MLLCCYIDDDVTHRGFALQGKRSILKLYELLLSLNFVE